jgi:hypothetical protein
MDRHPNDIIPTELWEFVSHHLCLQDHASLRAACKALHASLYRVQSQKRWLIARCNGRIGHALAFAFHNKNDRLIQALLETPGATQFDTVQEQYFDDICYSRTDNDMDHQRRKLRIISTIWNDSRSNWDQDSQQAFSFLSVFRIVCYYGEILIIKFLLETCKMSVDNVPTDSSWYLRLLMEQEGCEVIRLIVSYGATIPGNMDVLAQLTASQGNLNALKVILESIRDTSPAELKLALAAAWNACTYDGNVSIVEYLLEVHGADPSMCDNIALRWCCRRGYGDMLALLFKYGLSLAKVQDDISMYLAISNNHPNIVKLLIEDSGIGIIHVQVNVVTAHRCRTKSLFWWRLVPRLLPTILTRSD